MNRAWRVSASALVVQDGKVLLVKYRSRDGVCFLVGPGGGAEEGEDLHATVEREVFEETGMRVKPVRMLFVEDLLTTNRRILKFWFLCDLVGGQLSIAHQEAVDEGIIEVGWFSKAQLKDEIVYPAVIMDYDWDKLCDGKFEVQYLGMKEARF